MADAYDAMTSDRAYRPAGDPSAALAELAAKAGKQFDRVIVEALTRAIGDEIDAESRPLRAAAAV